MKIRNLPQNNYKAIYFNGKTLRIALDPSKDIYRLDYPEFYDVKITNKCNGCCSYCYQNSTKDSVHFPNVIDNIKEFFGKLTENQRPFQVAIGGGEPTLHPDFINILKTFNDLGIVPNYTTNGMHLTDEIEKATVKNCGGIAISCHPHLKKYWLPAIYRFLNAGIIVNLHWIIFDDESIYRFYNFHEKYKHLIDYSVLLPAINKGRCVDKFIDYDYLKYTLKVMNLNKIAFGAGFYKFLKENKWINASLYQPEAFSKYLDMSDMSIYNSSFE